MLEVALVEKIFIELLECEPRPAPQVIASDNLHRGKGCQSRNMLMMNESFFGLDLLKTQI